LFNRQPLFSLGVAERKCDAESAQWTIPFCRSPGLIY
jgi:hypothetical protein